SLALEGHAEGLAETTAGRSLEARHALWAGQLPDDPEALLAALKALPDEGRLALFAHVVSLSVNAVQRVGTSRRALAHAGVVADLVDLDMTRYWAATASSYFSRVTKALIAEAVAEGVSPEAAAPLTSLDKAGMAAKAEELLSGTGWLPPLLRRSGAAPA
ncbi:MAG: chromosome partitioning protein ParB, partial [Brevundimonas sp.]|nr:chromosome partitioning protein ParB [Brevundimonas sp.]